MLEVCNLIYDFTQFIAKRLSWVWEDTTDFWKVFESLKSEGSFRDELNAFWIMW